MIVVFFFGGPPSCRRGNGHLARVRGPSRWHVGVTRLANPFLVLACGAIAKHLLHWADF